jgi:pimeloyl-ACP methyl ester carboxylesterase
MHPLQERLASAFSTITIDWPGFGDQPRPALAWEPTAYVAFLRHVITQLHLRPFATIAAGHAATYALSLAADAPGSLGRLCLVAPTWRGPLPTVMPGRRGLGAWITRAGDLSIIGAVLYRINVNRPVVRMMARGHVSATRIGSRENRCNIKDGCYQSSRRTLRLNPFRHGDAGPNLGSGVVQTGKAGQRSDPPLWSRDTAPVKSRNGGARIRHARQVRRVAPWQACGARGISRRGRARGEVVS